MTQPKPLCGFLNVLKPPGMSSAQVVGYVRRLLNGAKAGHAGTLDPEAAGVLPVMVGKAARLFDDLQDKEKEYVAEVAFGVATDTQDAQGVPVARGDRWPDESAIRAVLPRFMGTILQTPPMYSALKQDGQRLYDLARRGREAVVPAREVTVHSLRLTGLSPNHGALLRVCCSRGFYVRTLCHDLGEALGCPAHMRFLLRTRSGPFALDTALTLEALAEKAARGTLAGCLLAAGSGPWAYAHGAGPARPGQRPCETAAMCRGRALPRRAWTRSSPFGLRLEGALLAVARRRGEEVKVRTWLAE